MTIHTNFNSGEMVYTQDGEEVIIQSIRIRVYKNVFDEETAEIIYDTIGGNCASYEEPQLSTIKKSKPCQKILL